MKSKIPVYLIAGYLGSGKTSFINGLLKSLIGFKSGVLINDFGEVNIDAFLVEKQVDEMVTLTNGCLCCTLSNELDDSLNKLVTADSDLSAVFVEASGIADPSQMIDLIYNSQNPWIEFRDLIYIVDATNFVDFYKQQTTLASVSIQSSKLILINKVDSASPDQILETESIINQLNNRALVINTIESQIDSRLIFDHNLDPFVQLKIGQKQVSNQQVEIYHHDCDDGNHQVDHKHREPHHKFEQLTIIEDKPVDPLLITNFLNRLPKNVYRAKGWLNCGKKSPDYKIILQIVGQQHRLRAEPWEADDHRQTILVLIGTDIKPDEIKQKFKACIDKQPDIVTEENLVNPSLFI